MITAFISLFVTLLTALLPVTASADTLEFNQDQQAVLGVQTPTLSAMASPISSALNVLKQPLALHSKNPVTGYLRDGYCHVPDSDRGNHAVAATMTEEFLDFTARQGNDLRLIGPEMKGGCKWCLCASRWLEAFEARGTHKDGDRIVPRVDLDATNEAALRKINLEDLQKFASSS